MRPGGRFRLLKRRSNTDKRNYGHVLIVAGSPGMSGAAVLAARAACMSGSGLVTLAVPKGLEKSLAKPPAELMTLSLPRTRRGCLAAGSFRTLMAYIQKRRITVMAMGPGLSTDPGTVLAVQRLVASSPIPVVLDADGINSFRANPGRLTVRRSSLVLTPHAGEFERLFGERPPRLRQDRIKLAKKLSKFYDVVLVLKGHRTLVTGNRKHYENHTGNPGMAKGGCGDVLTGMIASFIGQGLSPYEASAWAVYFHGLAGDIAVKRTGLLSLTASDLIRELPNAFSGRKY